MSKSRFTTRQLATAGIIAAVYTVMSMCASVFGIAYGPIQCRFSEALCVLPFFLPETADQFDFSEYDYVVDAVDTVTAKVTLVLEAQKAATRATEQAAGDIPCAMEPESAPDIPQGAVLDEVL